MGKRRVFQDKEKVLVRCPGKPAFIGPVYSTYFVGRERIICVRQPNGAGVGYRIRYVTQGTDRELCFLLEIEQAKEEEHESSSRPR